MCICQLLKTNRLKILTIAFMCFIIFGFVKNGFTAICPSGIGFGETEGI